LVTKGLDNVRSGSIYWQALEFSGTFDGPQTLTPQHGQAEVDNVET